MRCTENDEEPHCPLRRGRAALPARHGHRREDPRPRAPRLATRLNNLAGLYRDTGRYAEAEPLYRRALTILEKALPADHPNLATARKSYARLLDQLGRTDEAIALRAQAVAARPLPSPSSREPGGTK
jgi:tetratricopeptide (TPR) repeat protein